MSVGRVVLVLSLAALYPSATSWGAGPGSSPSAAGQTTSDAPTVVRLPGRSWWISLGDGWRQATPTELKAVQAAAVGAAKAIVNAPTPVYAAMFVPQEPDGRYVLVQEGKALAPNLSLKSMSKATSEGVSQVSAKLSGSSALSFDAPRVEMDEAQGRLCFLATIKGTESDVGLMNVMIPGAQQTLNVHLYAPIDAFDAARPGLQAFADGVRFDSGSAYVFGNRSATGTIDWDRAMTGALVGGAIGASVALAGWLRKRFGTKA